ncbi:hypothetical protein Tco_1030113 [Tanacetum coccineum]|uniref:Retrotransposon gag domain-containing protein n=1 Tax=Tanacetum coccineum TaxID=301880 RepID=A0ABQ5G760_9ASTR
MADNRTMAQMLQAPIEGYEDAIVVPPINANNFELKQPLINLVQSNKFTGRQDPHNHLRFFNKVTSTFRHPEVPNTSVKLLLFPFSLDGEARDWLDKEPPRSILTWDDLVSKFINQYLILKRWQSARPMYTINKVDPHGFEGYSNQTRANDKAIFVPPPGLIANYLLQGYLKIEREAKTTSFERLRGRPTTATKNRMILSYDVLIIQVDPHGFEGYLKIEVKVPDSS